MEERYDLLSEIVGANCWIQGNGLLGESFVEDTLEPMRALGEFDAADNNELLVGKFEAVQVVFAPQTWGGRRKRKEST
jgi:hypothetical protein